MMTTPEKAYVNAYRDTIDCVSNAERYVTKAHRIQLDVLEAQMSEDRIEELREIARRRMGT